MLTDDRKQEAKNEAIELLEYSIFAMCQILQVDVDALDSTFVNPTSEGEHLYECYEALINQVTIHESLTS